VSFSSLTRGIHQSTRSTTGATGESYALQYSAGAHVGNFLHALLENIQPDRPLREQLEQQVPYLTLKHNQKPKPVLAKLEEWLNNILHTPLNNTGLTLAGIPADRRIPELEFDFSTKGVNQKSLDTILQQAAGIDLPPLPAGYFRGMVTGSIDLVFEHDGRYYIADYKSNLLGRQLDDYRLDNLTKQIFARRYDLQYLLYTLALHRHLRVRLADYDYERDFGGAYYLFLRGMTPDTGESHGVFFNKPSSQLIKALDEQIFSIPEAQAS
jgi:exodeoxyribonuclease V beta subunit